MNQISVFDSPKPAFTAEEAQHLLKRDYGIDGKLKELVSERDQNFLVGSPAGKFVLKIANAVEDEGFLALQNAAMKHVAQADPSLGLQRVVATSSGADITAWEHGGSRHAVRLLTYLPGDLYSAAASSPALLESLGSFMGRLSHALRGFGHPAAFRREIVRTAVEIAARRAETGATLLIITHDASLAARCERVLTMADGVIVSDTAN